MTTAEKAPGAGAVQMEPVFVDRIALKKLPKGHFHWVAACNHCEERHPFASSPPMDYEQASAWIQKTKRICGNPDAFRLEIDVIP